MIDEAARLAWPAGRPSWVRTPTVTRNDLVFGAETTAQGIYLSVAFTHVFARAQSPTRNADDRLVRGVMRGLLLHEYGHWIDLAEAAATGAAPSSTFTSSSRSEAERAELWADAVAGCLLARSEVALDTRNGDRDAQRTLTDLLTSLYREGCSAPAAAARSAAIATGWNRCSADPTSPVTQALGAGRTVPIAEVRGEEP